MSTSVIVPDTTGSETLSGSPPTITGGANARTVLSDADNATYVAFNNGEYATLDLTDPIPTIPAGSLVKSYSVKLNGYAIVAADRPLVWTSLLRNTSSTIYDDTGQQQVTWASTPREWTAAVGNYKSGDRISDFRLRIAGLSAENVRITEARIDIVYVEPPVPTITAPTGTLSDNNRPTIKWSNDLDPDGGPQTGAIVRVFTNAQVIAAGFDPEVTVPYVCDAITDSSTEWRVPEPLPNDDYRAYVWVGQSGIGSDPDYQDFTIDTLFPDPPAVTLAADDDGGYTALTITEDLGADNVAATFFQVERVDEDAEADYVRTTLGDGLVLIDDPSDPPRTEVVVDYESPNGGSVTYRVRSVTWYATDSTATSDWTTVSGSSWSSDYWWLKHPDDLTQNIAVDLRSFQSQQRPARQSVKQPLGRDDVVVTSDTRSPESGTITIRIPDDDTRDAVQAFASTPGAILLQPPTTHHEPDRWVILGDEETTRLVDKSWADERDITYPWTAVTRPDTLLAEDFEAQISAPTEVSYVGAGAASHNDGTSATIAPALPTGLEEDDLMLLIWWNRQGGRTITWPAGWTEWYKNTTTSTWGIAVRPYQSGDTAPTVTYSSTLSGYTTIARVIAFRGIDPDGYEDTVGSEVATLDNAALGPIPAINAKYAGSAVLALAAWENDSTLTSGAPSGDGLIWNAIGETNTTDGDDGSLRLDYAIAPAYTKASVAAKTYTISGSNDTNGGRGMILAMARNPRPQVPLVLKEDLATAADPVTNLWKKITNYSSIQGATNPGWTQRTTSPDTFTPVLQSSAPTYYRRCLTIANQLNGSHDLSAAAFDAGTGVLTLDSVADFPTSGSVVVSNPATPGSGQASVSYTNKSGSTLTGCTTSSNTTFPDNSYVEIQSIYDGGVANQSIRNMLINNSATNTFYAYNIGDKLTTYMSMRIHAPTFNSATSDDAMLWQMRQVGGSSSPIIALHAQPGSTSSKADLVLVQNLTSGVDLFTKADIDLDSWFRVATKVNYDPNPSLGWIEFWVNTGGGMTQIGTREYCATVKEAAGLPGAVSTLSIGIYGEGGIVPGGYYCDYSAIQVVSGVKGTP